jgi:hypothetical protein
LRCELGGIVDYQIHAQQFSKLKKFYKVGPLIEHLVEYYLKKPSSSQFGLNLKCEQYQTVTNFTQPSSKAKLPRPTSPLNMFCSLNILL